jgi:uncharacterized protein YdeI (BOF family)
MSDNSTNSPTPDNKPEPAVSAKAKRSTYSIAGLAVLGTLILGVGAGAVGMKYMNRGQAQVLLEPVAVSAMVNDSTVAVKGTVAEVYGNSFIIQDASGRTLVDAGRHGDAWSLITPAALVTKDEVVTVQGHFENGSVHASMLVHADGKAVDLRPAGRGHGGGKHGDGGDHDRRGDLRGDRSSDQGTAAAPRG